MIVEIEDNTILIHRDEAFEPIIHHCYANGHTAQMENGLAQVTDIMLNMDNPNDFEDLMDELLITLIDFHGEKQVRQLLDLWAES